MSLPVIAPSRHHRQNRQRPLTLLKLVRSRSNGNYESRASDDVLRGCRPGSRRHVLCGKRPTARKKDKFARSDKSHIVRHKIGRWEKATGGPGTGNPARPRADHFMIAQCVLILRAREHRPRRRAPVRPHSANWNKLGAGETRRTSTGGSLRLFPRATVLGFPFTAKKEKSALARRLEPGGSSGGPGAIRARGGNGACRWRVHGTAQPARARFW